MYTGYMILVFACDEGFAMPLATTLRSIVEANRSGMSLEAYVLYDDFSEMTQKKVLIFPAEGIASIRWIQIDLTPFRNLRHCTTFQK